MVSRRDRKARGDDLFLFVCPGRLYKPKSARLRRTDGQQRRAMSRCPVVRGVAVMIRWCPLRLLVQEEPEPRRREGHEARRGAERTITVGGGNPSSISEAGLMPLLSSGSVSNAFAGIFNRDNPLLYI
jgi:hypothetical protein